MSRPIIGKVVPAPGTVPQCDICGRELATRSTRTGPDSTLGRLLCWTAVVDLDWAREECGSYQAGYQTESGRVRSVLLSSVQLHRELAEVSKQRDEAVGLLQLFLLPGRHLAQRLLDEEDAMAFLRRIDQENKAKP